MPRYIDSDTLRDEVLHNIEGYDNDIVNFFLNLIDYTEDADVKEVVRGEWIECEDGDYVQNKCSKCGSFAIFGVDYVDDYDENCDGDWILIGTRANGVTEHLTYFCPNCGADMRGEQYVE